jgi:hypothetical protein
LNQNLNDFLDRVFVLAVMLIPRVAMTVVVRGTKRIEQTMGGLWEGKNDRVNDYFTSNPHFGSRSKYIIRVTFMLVQGQK